VVEGHGTLFTHLLQQTGSCDHVFEAVFFDLLHIALVLEHLAYVYHLLNILFSCLVVLSIVFDQKLIVCFHFGVVKRVRLVVELAHVHLLLLLHLCESAFDFVQELLSRHGLLFL